MALATREQVGNLIRAVIEKRQPALRHQVHVTFTLRPSYMFRAHRTEGGKVVIVFSVSPKDKHWNLALEEATRAAYQLRYTTTHAVSICGGMPPCLALVPWLDTPRAVMARERVAFVAARMV